MSLHRAECQGPLCRQSQPCPFLARPLVVTRSLLEPGLAVPALCCSPHLHGIMCQSCLAWGLTPDNSWEFGIIGVGGLLCGRENAHV